jgi:hypothetical protein
MRCEFPNCCPRHTTLPTLRLGPGHQFYPSSHAPDLSLNTLRQQGRRKGDSKFPEVTESWFKPGLKACAPAQGMSCNSILIPICRMIQNSFCSTLTGCVAYFRESSSFFGVSFVYGCFRTGWTYCTPRIWFVAWQQLLVPWTLAFIQPIDRALPPRSTWQDASALVTGVDFYVCNLLA